MYEHLFQFFGLRQNPFHVSPDPRTYFSTRAHDLALSELIAGIESRRGLFVLTGEPGTGKTILLHHLLDWLATRHQSTCYIFQSQLKPTELLELILQDFGICCDSREKRDMIVALNHWLVERRRLGDAPVLIIDEAQAVSLRTLHRLNMLLNLEIEGSKLLQIILVGQPGLDNRLGRPELWQLQQRVIFRSSLAPFSFEETSRYVKSRLEDNGAQEPVFSDESLQAIHLCAQGVPRVVNLLCEHALISAYLEKEKLIGPEVINRVAAEFELDSHSVVLSEERVPPGPELPSTACVHDEGSCITVTTTITEAVEKIETPDLAKVPATVKWPLEEPAESRAVPAVQEAAVAEIAERNAPLPVASVATARPLRPAIRPLKSKRSAPRQWPINWKGPNLLQRFAGYWRAVLQSFVQDCTRFIREYTQARKYSGAEQAPLAVHLHQRKASGRPTGD